MADLLRKYRSLYSSTANSFGTGSSETITPASVVGLPTDTEITLTFDRVNSQGVSSPSSMERIVGTISGGNFVIRTSPTSGRGFDSSTEQAHTSPVVEMIWNAKDWNDSIDAILTEHGQDGTHDDSIVALLDGAQTFTGVKTFASPVINTGISGTAIVDEDDMASDSDTKVPTQQSVKAYVDASGSTDGWLAITDTLTYASATTFTVSGDQTAKYSKGTRIKLSQTSVKYFVVTASAHAGGTTTVTITGGTDYTLANEAITDPFYSYQANPQGYPKYFSFTPATTPTGSMTYSSVTSACKFSVLGGFCTFFVQIDGTIGGTLSNGINVSAPITIAIGAYLVGGGALYTNGVTMVGAGYWNDGSTVHFTFKRYDNGNFSSGVSQALHATIVYPI